MSSYGFTNPFRRSDGTPFSFSSPFNTMSRQRQTNSNSRYNIPEDPFKILGLFDKNRDYIQEQLGFSNQGMMSTRNTLQYGKPGQGYLLAKNLRDLIAKRQQDVMNQEREVTQERNRRLSGFTFTKGQEQLYRPPGQMPTR